MGKQQKVAQFFSPQMAPTKETQTKPLLAPGSTPRIVAIWEQGGSDPVGGGSLYIPLSLSNSVTLPFK